MDNMLDTQTLQLDQIKVLITSECNLNCTHCFRSFDKNKYFINSEKLIELADFAVKTHCNNISFSGGEFFTHPFAYDLLEYCYQQKLRVKILTNATNIQRIEFFEKYQGTNLLSFQISLDGMKEHHDLRRGAGTFDRTMNNVQKLKTLGFDLTVSMTIDQKNIYDVVDVMNIPYFDKFNFLPVAYAGEETTKGRPILDSEYREYEKLLRILYTSRENTETEDYRCRMFPYQLGIRYDGNVYPCAVARDYDMFLMGNIYEKSIEKIVKDYFYNPSAKELLNYKDNHIQECVDCPSKQACNRGCRIRAKKYCGVLKAPDPFCCKIYEDKFSDIPINCIFWGES